MRQLALVVAASTALWLLAADDTEPLLDTTYLELERELGRVKRAGPTLIGAHGGSFDAEALRHADPDVLFDRLMIEWLSQRRPRPSWILRRLRSVGASLPRSWIGTSVGLTRSRTTSASRRT